MKSRSRIGAGALALLVGAALLAAGCGRGDPGAAPGATEKPAPKGSKHDEWWCKEHGIPEEECSMCSAKVAKACKAAGDWCEKHDRAKSQCFLCDPKRQEFYAAKYRAKYGKEPPPIEE
jgi:hypothetical protein